MNAGTTGEEPTSSILEASEELNKSQSKNEKT